MVRHLKQPRERRTPECAAYRLAAHAPQEQYEQEEQSYLEREALRAESTQCSNTAVEDCTNKSRLELRAIAWTAVAYLMLVLKRKERPSPVGASTCTVSGVFLQYLHSVERDIAVKRAYTRHARGLHVLALRSCLII